MTPQGNKETSFSLSSRSCIFEDDSVGNWGRKTYTPPAFGSELQVSHLCQQARGPQQWLRCQASLLRPAKEQKPSQPTQPCQLGQRGPLPTAAQARARRMSQGPALWTGGCGERRGHAQEAVAESGAEQERHEGGMKGLVRRGDSQGPRGSAGGCWLASCSEILRVGGIPGLLQQLLPRSEPVLAPLPGRRGGKGGSTWVLLYGLADGRSVNDRFIHFIPSCPTLQVRLNQFVMVTLGSFVSLIINNGVMGQLSRKPPGPCAGTRGDLRAR